MENIVELLTSKDAAAACDFAGKIILESHESNCWYKEFDTFVSLLDNKNSFVRNRIVYILAANAKWDVENKFNAIIDTFLTHVTDEKPITARQCVKSLVEIGQAKPELVSTIIEKLQKADLSKYKDSMRPLIESDIKETIQILKK